MRRFVIITAASAAIAGACASVGCGDDGGVGGGAVDQDGSAPPDATFDSAPDAYDAPPDSAADADATPIEASADGGVDASDASDAADAFDAADAQDAGDASDASDASDAPDASDAADAADAAEAGTVFTVRVSVDSSGTPGNANSAEPAVSSDGRFVVFSSPAKNLVPNDTNVAPDIFVHDVQLGTTVRASVTSAGVEASYDSSAPVVSADGRYVSFQSEAINLCPGKTGFHMDVIVHDMQTGTTSCASLDSSGAPGTGYSGFPSISDDGRYVAFESTSPTLIANQYILERQIYVHDMQTGATTLVSSDNAGNPGNFGSHTPAISGNGRFVAFVSGASNLVAGDTNGVEDIFVRDLVAQTTERVSVSSTGAQSDGHTDMAFLSRDGSIVFFSGTSTTIVPGAIANQWDMFVRDRTAGTTAFVVPAIGGSNSIGGTSLGRPSASADGRYFVFYSSLSNVLPGKSSSGYDTYVVDRSTGVVSRVNRTPSGVGSDGSSDIPMISADGRYVVFQSTATNLVATSGGTAAQLYESTRP